MAQQNITYTLLATSEPETQKMNETPRELGGSDLSLVVIEKNNHLLQTSTSTSTTMKDKSESKRVFYENITTVVHIILLQFVIFILYLSFSHEVELFTWHPILLSIGWCLLMTEAIIALSNENCLTKLFPHKNKVFLHWIIQTVAAICILTGFVIVIVNKNLKNKHHFKTWHAIFGLISIICCIPTGLNGILTLFKVELRQYINPKLNKFIHISFGSVTFIFGTVTVVLSLYSNWFVKKTGYTSQVICLIAIIIVALWVMVKPGKYLIKNMYRKH